MRIGDWEVYAHPLFLGQFEALTAAAERARRRNPAGYGAGRDAKMLAAVLKLAFEDIPADPGHRRFEQGDTLGPARKHWRRAKFHQQYRLFFRFSTAARVIVLAWVNDEHTKRADGRSTDAYATFGKMLKQGDPPDDWEALLMAAKKPSATARLSAARLKE